MKRKLTLEQAIRWCDKNKAHVRFFDGLVEVEVDNPSLTSWAHNRSFKAAVTALARKLEKGKVRK